MTKKDLVERVAWKTNVPKAKAREIIQATLDEIIDILAQDGRLDLRNFGIFETVLRKGRPGRNPLTGAKVMIPPQVKTRFKPGRIMKDRIS